MAIKKPEETMMLGDKRFTVGGRVFSNSLTEYRYLFGTVKAFVNGEECGKEPGASYILCDFDAPDSVDMIEDLEDRFSKKECGAMDLSDIKLTDIPMKAEALEPVEDQLHEPNPQDCSPYTLTYQVEGENGISFGCLGISNNKGLLLRAMLNDAEEKEARLVEVEESEDRYYFSCEVPGRFLFLEYELTRVRDYTTDRKELAA